MTAIDVTFDMRSDTPEGLDPDNGTELVDLAAAPDGQRVALITRRGADWRLLEVDLSAAAGTAPRLLMARSAPMQALRHSAAGLEFIMAEGGVPNVCACKAASCSA